MSVTATASDRRAAAVFDDLRLLRGETREPELVLLLGGRPGQMTTLWAAVCPTCAALDVDAIERALLTRALREEGVVN